MCDTCDERVTALLTRGKKKFRQAKTLKPTAANWNPLSEQDIERGVVVRRDWADSVGPQGGYEGRTQILRGYWSGDLRSNTVVQAPFHWKTYYS